MLATILSCAMTAAYIIPQAAASTSPLKDLLLASEEGRLHDVQSLLDEGRCKVNDEDEVCTVEVCVCVFVAVCISVQVYLRMHLCMCLCLLLLFPSGLS